jgi:hypothetical protein
MLVLVRPDVLCPDLPPLDLLAAGFGHVGGLTSFGKDRYTASVIELKLANDGAPQFAACSLQFGWGWRQVTGDLFGFRWRFFHRGGQSYMVL